MPGAKKVNGYVSDDTLDHDLRLTVEKFASLMMTKLLLQFLNLMILNKFRGAP